MSTHNPIDGYFLGTVLVGDKGSTVILNSGQYATEAAALAAIADDPESFYDTVFEIREISP